MFGFRIGTVSGVVGVDAERGAPLILSPGVVGHRHALVKPPHLGRIRVRQDDHLLVHLAHRRRLQDSLHEELGEPLDVVEPEGAHERPDPAVQRLVVVVPPSAAPSPLPAKAAVLIQRPVDLAVQKLVPAQEVLQVSEQVHKGVPRLFPVLQSLGLLGGHVERPRLPSRQHHGPPEVSGSAVPLALGDLVVEVLVPQPRRADALQLAQDSPPQRRGKGLHRARLRQRLERPLADLKREPFRGALQDGARVGRRVRAAGGRGRRRFLTATAQR